MGCWEGSAKMIRVKVEQRVDRHQTVVTPVGPGRY